MVVDVVAGGLLDAPADALANPIVIVWPEKVAIALKQLFRQGAHLPGSKARIDAKIFERAIEPIDVFVHFEQAVIEAARHIERAVAIDPASVAKGNADLAFGQEHPVEPGNPLVAARVHMTPRVRT